MCPQPKNSSLINARRLMAIAACSLVGLSSHALAAPQQHAKSAKGLDTNTELLRRVARSMERARTDTRGAGVLPDPVTDADYRPLDADQVELGKLLYHDKILSGNMNTSCATCHNMLTDTSDGLSLPVGEGGMGLGPARETGFGPDEIEHRVPRNAPHIFNLGAYEFSVLMHDGRIAADPSQPSGFKTPASFLFMNGIDSTVAAQACFPVTSADEMAGQNFENDVSKAAAQGNLPKVWAILAKRVATIPEYAQMFIDVYDDVNIPQDVTYAHIANAIGAYESAVGRSDNSPFDRYLRGDTGAMSMNAIDGMNIFYGKANCVQCHSGKFQTNHSFAAIAMPQIGPGKGHNQPGFGGGYDDFGLAFESGNLDDFFKFRVPSLRNVALTGPYGHAGAYATLEAVVRHHLDPVNSLLNYDQSQAVLPFNATLSPTDFTVMNDPDRVAGIAAANELAPVDLTEEEIAQLMEFLHALTDTDSIDLRWAIPMRVPSGLPVFD
ncbi:MAG: cytochrome-c peroxidase [Phycisphaerales bacterium]